MCALYLTLTVDQVSLLSSRHKEWAGDSHCDTCECSCSCDFTSHDFTFYTTTWNVCLRYVCPAFFSPLSPLSLCKQSDACHLFLFLCTSVMCVALEWMSRYRVNFHSIATHRDTLSPSVQSQRMSQYCVSFKSFDAMRLRVLSPERGGDN